MNKIFIVTGELIVDNYWPHWEAYSRMPIRVEDAIDIKVKWHRRILREQKL